MNPYLYFFIAYGLAWVLIAWYMFSLTKKQKALQDEIQVLKNRVRIRG